MVVLPHKVCKNTKKNEFQLISFFFLSMLSATFANTNKVCKQYN